MTIDGVTIKSPSGDTPLKEYYQYIRNDNVALLGNMQRNQLNKKKVAELTWDLLYPSELQAILAWADDTNTHAYSNADTNRIPSPWAFTGLVTITTDASYVRGASHMVSGFSVMIREV